MEQPTTDRIVVRRKPRKCPACGEGPLARVLYGLPAYSPELERQLAEEKVVLGGCCLSVWDPAWQCTQCDTFIYREGDSIEVQPD